MSQSWDDSRGVLLVYPQDDHERKQKYSDNTDPSIGYVIHGGTPNHTLIAQAQPLMIRNYDREVCSNRHEERLRLAITLPGGTSDVGSEHSS
jgi:hypothetical protein